MDIFLSVNTKRRDHVGDLGADGRIILKCILNKSDASCELDLPGSG
jgi:hypothetical protein